jgi:N,N'-diacetyllegionaminate synthase
MGILIIAEAGMNHDGSLGNACRMVDIAANCGAGAIKFQTHISAAETLRDAPMPPYFKGEPRFEYFERTAFSRERWVQLKAYCDKMKIGFLSSPFSIEAVDLLEDVGIDQYKIPSGEITNLPYLDAIAQTGKPILLSSGMSNWDELDAAVNLIRCHHDHLTLLQCTSDYPCEYGNVGLNVMLDMKERFATPVGLSDHTLSNYASFAAVSMGASVIEKHFTLSRNLYGSDAKHSLEPEGLADLVEGIRAIEVMLTTQVDKNAIGKFRVMKETFEKSLVSLVPIQAGMEIKPKMIGIKKPGTGIPAAKYGEVIGRQAVRDIDADVLLQEEDFE